MSVCRSSRSSTSTEPDAVSGDEPTVRCWPESVPVGEDALAAAVRAASGDRTTSSASAVPVTPTSTSLRSSPAAALAVESERVAGVELERVGGAADDRVHTDRLLGRGVGRSRVGRRRSSATSAAVARSPSIACVNTVPLVPMIACSCPAKRNSNEPSRRPRSGPRRAATSIGRFVAARSAIRLTVRSPNRAPAHADPRVPAERLLLRRGRDLRRPGRARRPSAVLRVVEALERARSAPCAAPPRARARRSRPSSRRSAGRRRRPSSRRTCSCTDGWTPGVTGR